MSRESIVITYKKDIVVKSKNVIENVYKNKNIYFANFALLFYNSGS